MNVLTITSLFPNAQEPNFCGFIYRRMAKWAEKYGTSWTVIAPIPFFPKLPLNTKWNKFANIPLMEDNGICIVYHPRYLMLPYFGLFFQALSMELSINMIVKKFLKIHKVDIIDAHYVYPDGYAAYKISERYNIPVVVSARGTDINYYPKIQFVRNKIVTVLTESDALIGVSRSLIHKMIDLGAKNEKCYFAPNGVDFEIFKMINDNKTSRRIVAVGNLIKEKGFHRIIKSISMVKKKYSNIKLEIYGDGPERKNLNKLIRKLNLEDNVYMMGCIDHYLLPKKYANSNMLVIASEREGFPNIVLEAFACGIPVVAPKVGEIPYLINDGINGILLNDIEPEQIFDGINKALQIKWNKQKIYNTVKDKTWDNTINIINNIFSSVSN